MIFKGGCLRVTPLFFYSKKKHIYTYSARAKKGFCVHTKKKKDGKRVGWFLYMYK